MNNDITTEPLLLDDEFGCLIVAESVCRDLDDILSDIQTAHGAAFVSLLKEIAFHPAFSPLDDDTHIYTVGGESGEDYANLLNAARKAVDQGYRVFILPNPKGIRTADFVFEKKGNYKSYDLKTIIGKGSAGTRLLDSIGQSNRVLLNIHSDYNARLLASDIKTYFEVNETAVEVLIFKGKKYISINRFQVQGPMFNRLFRKQYEK